MRRVFIKTFIFSEFPEVNAAADFCRVTAKVRPLPESEITTEVWLPRAWNGKFVGTGGGGFNGGLMAASIALAPILEKGYAGMAHDAGHPMTDSAEFAHKHRDQYLDYAYRANNVATKFSKELVAAYYAAPAKRAYFQGCSNGGRDALMEAKRYPDGYDGIIAGAPAAAWSKLMIEHGWALQATRAAPNLKSKLKLVQDAVMAKCDALDGVKDKLIENPLKCEFDAAELQCTGADGPACLNADEVAAVRKVHGGPHLKDGTPVGNGFPKGGEALPYSWDLWLVANKKLVESGLAVEGIRWMAYGDPKWRLDDFDVDRTYAVVKERVAPLMDSDDPNLSAFVRRGGKLLMYHGWNDAAIPAKDVIDYHAAVLKTLGHQVDKQVRLFMVPGMAHCSGGAGTTTFDMLDQIDRWVQTGAAPERIIATEYDPMPLLGITPGAKVVRTRPLCPWPKVARYLGSGSTDDAVNFRCE